MRSLTRFCCCFCLCSFVARTHARTGRQREARAHTHTRTHTHTHSADKLLPMEDSRQLTTYNREKNETKYKDMDYNSVSTVRKGENSDCFCSKATVV